MQTWLFQGNPDEYDIDGYLHSRPAQLVWLVTRYASEIAVGDRIYLWRNQGKLSAIAGIVAEGIIIAPPELRSEDPDGQPFWKVKGTRSDAPQVRAVMRLVKVATKREVILRHWCEEDPLLVDLPNLKMQAGTNYRLTADQALRLDALWSRTGRDWTWNESVAGLWAYAQTYDQPVSKLPGTPVANVALLIGRAVTGVYAKVMNFRSIDPRALGAGMSGAGATDRIVWNDFFDATTSALRTHALDKEFNRIWSIAPFDAVIPPELNATEAIVEDEAGRLEELDLQELIAKYLVQTAERPRRPSARVLSARAYERNPLVIVIARKRASYRCEIPECAHPPFEIGDGVPYTEVHHITPLAVGGEDSIENVACLCAAHHREIHLGVKATELTAQLKAIRLPPHAEKTRSRNA